MQTLAAQATTDLDLIFCDLSGVQEIQASPGKEQL